MTVQNSFDMDKSTFWPFAHNLRQRARLCDIVMYVKGARGDLVGYPAHKLLLVNESKYFQALFDTDKLANQYHFPDVTEDALYCVLEVIYKGVLPPDVANLQAALSAAHVLKVDRAIKLLEERQSSSQKKRPLASMAPYRRSQRNATSNGHIATGSVIKKSNMPLVQSVLSTRDKSVENPTGAAASETDQENGTSDFITATENPAHTLEGQNSNAAMIKMENSNSSDSAEMLVFAGEDSTQCLLQLSASQAAIDGGPIQSTQLAEDELDHEDDMPASKRRKRTKKTDKHICPVCSTCINTRNNLIRHIQEHQGRRFKCPNCNRTCKRKHDLFKHIMGIHWNDLCEDEKESTMASFKTLKPIDTVSDNI